MAEWMVDPGILRGTGVQGIDSCAKSLMQIREAVRGQSVSLRLSGYGAYALKRNLQNICGEIEREAASFGRLSSALENAALRYRDTENRLAGKEPQSLPRTTAAQDGTAKGGNGSNKILNGLFNILRWFGGLIGIYYNPPGEIEYEVDSIVFDDAGDYGGNQGSPESWENPSELYDIIRKYYPDMTDEEAYNYLVKLNSEGCGYVAIINTIFAAYEGRADEFRETFGFDMYDETGDLNYDRLLVDFYTATDNKNESGYDENEDPSDTEGWGTSANSREYRTHLYLDEKGVDVKFDNGCEITPENFEEYAKNGSIIISYHYGNLYKENGMVGQYIDGGHAMVVTGVTDDGKYIVSSWGETYYIDPAEILGPPRKDNTTWMGFQYIEYPDHDSEQGGAGNG